MNKSFAITVPFALLMAHSAFAAAPMKPGLWETTAVIEMPAVLKKVNTTIRSCFTADDIKNPQRLIPVLHEVGMKCEIKEYKLVGDNASFKETCTDKTTTMSGAGSMVMKADSYSYSANLEQKPLDAKSADKVVKVKETLTGKHIGECK